MRPLVLLCLSVILACAVSAAEDQAPLTTVIQDRPVKVLFCGNSYMSSNGTLMAPLEKLARLPGSRLRIEWDAYTKAGSTIGGRWALTRDEREAALDQHDGRNPTRREQAGTLAEVIAKGGYDLLILQQFSRGDNIIKDSEPVIAAARAAGTRVAFFMTWSNSQETGPDWPIQEKLTRNYREAAEHFGVGLIPCGLVFQDVKTLDPNIRIYKDLHHPNGLGHGINALSVYAWLTGSDLSELPSQAGMFSTKKSARTAEEIEAAVRKFVVTRRDRDSLPAQTNAESVP